MTTMNINEIVKVENPGISLQLVIYTKSELL